VHNPADRTSRIRPSNKSPRLRAILRQARSSQLYCGQGQPEKISAENSGAELTRVPSRVTLIVATHDEAQARWRPKLLEPGQAVRRLFDNTVDIDRPEGAIDIFARAVTGCVAISGPRPSTEQVAPLLLALCDRVNHDTALV
jgi:hypothetical protein